VLVELVEELVLVLSSLAELSWVYLVGLWLALVVLSS